MAEKPSLTVSGAAAQITRTGSSWSDDLGEGTSVSFAFRASAPPGGIGAEGQFAQLNTAQINIALLAFQSWADVANISFQRVGSGTSGASAYSNNASILLGGINNGADFYRGFANLPGENGVPGDRSFGSVEGDAYFNNRWSFITSPTEYNRGMLVFTHEIGHALGLMHPGDYNRAPGEEITYAEHAEYKEDTVMYSVMSYFSETYTAGDYHGLYPAAPQLHDIAAAQRLYGANMTTRTGDTVYGFNSNADRPWFTGVNSASPMIFSVWDAGGRDTLDFSRYGYLQKIDLGQGHFSSVGGMVNNVSIAFGAVIEDAIGGISHDWIIGNPVANALSGNAGDDTLRGLGGNDTLKGGAGHDRMDGGAGADTVAFGTVAAGLVVNLAAGTASGEGSDTLLNVENVVGSRYADALTGSAAANILDGAQGADTLIGGGGTDRLIGSKGADEMTGGAGGDAFVFLGLVDSVTKSPDLIADLEDADTIDLSGIDADATQAGNQAFVLVARFTGHAGEATLQWNALRELTILKLDDDGDRKADMVVEIDGQHTDHVSFVL